MRANVLLVGAGKLGSRYLQGLALCRFPLNISVVDPNKDSLTSAKAYWELISFKQRSHTVKYYTDLDNLPASLDLCLVVTNADIRLQVVKEVKSQCNVRYWVLEKVLAQSTGQLEDLENCLVDAEGAWVNTSRRMMKWHQQIFNVLPKNARWQIYVSGGSWGLACNAIHFVDLASWWTGNNLERIDTKKLETWVPSKRTGFWEISGSLLAYYTDGSQLELVDDQNLNDAINIKFQNVHGDWLLNESKGTFLGPNNISIPGRIEFQSEMAGSLVEQIFLDGTCALPELRTSVAMHMKLVGGLLSHWNETQQRDDEFLPIT